MTPALPRELRAALREHLPAIEDEAIGAVMTTAALRYADAVNAISDETRQWAWEKYGRLLPPPPSRRVVARAVVREAIRSVAQGLRALPAVRPYARVARERGAL